MGASDSKKAMFWANIIYDRTGHSRHDGFRAAISVHLGDFQAANSFLQKFKLARPEIKTLDDDFKKVSPLICEEYLLSAMQKIW